MKRHSFWSGGGHALVATLAVASVEIACGGISIDDSGYEDQPCYHGTRCHTGLVCISDYCVKPPHVTVDGGKPDAADAAPPTFDAGPASCATSEVFCDGVCVPAGPLHCGAACTRCPAADGGVATCVNGVCG